jgi:RNA polymerase sigma-70 factor (ECF subfamily)
LLLFDVLGFPVAEIATIMDTSTTAINSALARARRMIAAELPDRSQLETTRRLGDGRLRDLVDGFAAAMERADLDGMITLLTEDVSWSMPPLPVWYQGIERVAEFTAKVPLACGTWRCVVVESNAQPAIACYLRRPGEPEHRAWSISVLTLRADKIAALTSFLGDDHFTAFGLPLVHA